MKKNNYLVKGSVGFIGSHISKKVFSNSLNENYKNDLKKIGSVIL